MTSSLGPGGPEVDHKWSRRASRSPGGPRVRIPLPPAKSPLRNLMPTISAQPAEVADPPPKTLSPLQQCAHVRDRVGIAFQAVRLLFGLQLNLQPDAVRIVEVEGLAIPPFDNFGHRDPMVLEPLVGGVKFARPESEHLRRHLSGWAGILRADAYARFGELYEPRAKLPADRGSGVLGPRPALVCV